MDILILFVIQVLCKAIMLVSRRILQLAASQSRLSSSAASNDTIVKLFLEKINEYKVKSNSAPDGLVDADETVRTRLNEELLRVKTSYRIQNDESKITSTFDDNDFKLDPIDLKLK